TGAVGAYFLIKTFSDHDSHNKHSISQHMIPFLGAFFYLFNLATIQMFYVPYEAFSAFYGALPWLILASINYFSAKQNSRKPLLILVTILLLSTPAWYVQTFFVVFLMTLSIILLTFLLKKPIWERFKKSIKLYAIIFFINSFWLLPVAYFSITSSSVNINSKINQMGTDSIIAMNKEFGTIPNVMLLKGFSFNSIDPNAKGDIEFMLKPWRNHLNNPFIMLSGFIIFAAIFVGFIKAIISKNPLTKSFAVLFILSFVALCIDTPPFSYLNSLFRNIPVVNQIFRFPFTKFATLASLVYALLLALGTQEITRRISKIPYILIILIFLVIFPVFNGHLFYDKERTKIPQEYTQLFDFFKDQDRNTKIVNFPQQNFWGWNFYNWPNGGYGGSGFLWYGIRQPILDRNFDVWSKTNENFYYEISQALYSKNMSLFENLLDKYQITWLLIDKNVFDVASNKTLFIPELEEMLISSGKVKKEATFGKLEVYKIDLKDKPKDFVFISKNLPVVNKYNWNNVDQAYIDLGNYISGPTNGKWEIANGKSIIYPFRSLFTLKTQKEKEFSIIEKRSNIEITTELPPGFKGTLTIPSFTEKEKQIPVYLKTQKTNNGEAQIVAKVLLPEIVLGGKKVNKTDNPTFQIQLPNVKPEQYPLIININGSSFPAVANDNKDIGVTFFIPQVTNTLTVSDNSKKTVAEVIFKPEVLAQVPTGPQSFQVDTEKSKTLTISIPKIDASAASFHPTLKDANKVNNCDEFRGKDISSRTSGNQSLNLRSNGATACTAFFAPNLSHEKGFAVFIKSEHKKGQALRFWIENTDQKSIPLDTFLPKDKKQTTSSFILSPMEAFGNSYAFHFYNTSIGREKTENDINSISAYPVFYNYLKSIQIKNNTNSISGAVNTSTMKVTHPNESLYVISDLPKLTKTDTNTIVLSQAYDKGWRAYTVGENNWFTRTFPFIFGRKVKEHVMVNNWQNGWTLNNSHLSSLSEIEGPKSQIVIVYLPQYLQYFGFVLLSIALLYSFCIKSTRKRNSKADTAIN
ncbi:MAG TPA: hypothetical protein VM077_02775, partial [Candidatus Limnocylindrales bacterium]|nr:hypothetical protein [Candidatus Limnocylindrales bacterium]